MCVRLMIKLYVFASHSLASIKRAWYQNVSFSFLGGKNLLANSEIKKISYRRLELKCLIRKL